MIETFKLFCKSGVISIKSNLEYKFIKLTNDKLFKETFGNKKNIKYLEDFIESYLELKQDSLNKKLQVSYESSIPNSTYKEKANRCDLIVLVDNKLIINLEMYKIFNDEAFKKSRLYLMKIASLQLQVGKKYKSLIRVEQLNIIEKLSTKKYKVKRKLKYCINIGNDDIKMNFYTLDFLGNKEYNESRFTKWLRFINANTEKERENISKGDKILMNLNKWLEDYTSDKILSEFFNDDFWNKRIYTLDGINKGHEEIANEMLKQNYKVEEIAKLTKLKIQEIMNLKRKLDLK